MKRLFLFCLIFSALLPAQGVVVRRRVVAAGGGSTPTLVQSPTLCTQGVTCTAAGVTEGNTVIFWFYVNSGTPTAVTLTGSGTTLTLTSMGTPCSTGSNTLYGYYGVVGSANAGNTSFNHTGSLGSPEAYIQEWSGMPAFDKAACTNGTGTAVAGPSQTPAAGGEFALGFARIDLGTTLTPGNGYSNVTNQNAAAKGASYKGSISSATNSVWTAGGSGNWAAWTALF